MKPRPSSEKPAPSSTYGHEESAPESSGTTLPAPMPTAKAVSRLRHQARYVRSLASRVRRVASTTSGSSSNGEWGRPATGRSLAHASTRRGSSGRAARVGRAARAGGRDRGGGGSTGGG